MEVIQQFYAGFVFPAMTVCVCVCVTSVFNSYVLWDIQIDDCNSRFQNNRPEQVFLSEHLSVS